MRVAMRPMTAIPMRSRGVSAAPFIAISTILIAAYAGAADAPDRPSSGGQVKPAQTVAALLAEAPEGTPKRTTVVGIDGAAIFRAVGATIFVCVGAGGVLWAYRRWGRPTVSAPDSGGLRVAGRVALTAKHLVYELRVGRERILVGVVGDRMCPLGVLVDPPGRDAVSTPATPQEPRRFAGSTVPVEESDLLPYRRQVNRLRELLRESGPDSREAP
jgi:flagellar biogenesis protein FliO